MNTVRVVFEKGVTIRRSADGMWYFQSVRNQQPLTPVQPTEVANNYGIRPILITDQLASGEERTYLLPLTTGKDILELELSQLTQGDWKDAPTLFSVFNVSYIVGAVVYHCKQLAEIYSGLCYTFAHLPFLGDYDSDLVMFGHQPEPYYEFDALITATRRAYDTTRYILWRAFGPAQGSVPSSFARTFPQCTNMPSSLATRLQASWSQYGEKLTEYRDCIQHYVPLDFGLSSAHMMRLDGRVWSATLLIPDNPEVKSKAQLRYDSKIDALSYGWRLTNEIVDVTAVILNAIPK